MLKELAVSPELKTAEAEKTDQTAAENLPETEEAIVPTISSASEKPFANIETKKDSLADLNQEVAPIGISPIRETGELAPDLIEQEAIVEPEPIEPPQPQNFDDYILPGFGISDRAAAASRTEGRRTFRDRQAVDGKNQRVQS